MSIHSHEGVPHREHDSPYARAYTAKLDELLSAGRHPDDAAWEAGQHAKAAIAPSEATANAAVVAALGITNGAAPAPSTSSVEPTQSAVEPEAFFWDDVLPPKGSKTGPAVAETTSSRDPGPVDATLNWDEIVSELNANRR